MKITKGKLIKRIVIAFLCVILLVYTIGSFFAVKFVFKENFKRPEKSEFTGFLRYEDVADSCERETVQFYSGENKLTGYIYGKDNNKGLVVISHGMGDDSEGYISETLYFIDHGYCVFGFDNTGSGQSEGDSMLGMAQSAIDLDSALTYIESNEELSSLPVLLYGHSWGGYAVSAVLDSGHDIKAAVSIAGYNTPMGIVTEFSENMMGKTATCIEYPFIWLNNKLTFGDKADDSAVDSINSSNTHVMIVHGTDDEMVSFDNASIISQRDEITNPNVIYKVMDGKGHNDLFLSDESAEYIKENNEEYDKLYEQYDGDIPYEIKKEYYDNIDKNKTCKLSGQFMSDVNDFYLNALGMSD
ncbi:MAG: alpha/beta hydrolase family protein [Porcipelethomonas sp.]